MKVTEFKIKGPLLIEPKIFGDARGFFVERYRKDLFRELGLPDFFQDNFSRSCPGVLRGLHFQYDKPQSKLVSATAGRLFDVAVDIRSNSPTFGQHVSVELHGDKPAWFWLPAGFAHGFQVLGDQPADIIYKVDQPYNAHGESGILWSDAKLSIGWPDSRAPVVSLRDAQLPSWTEVLKSKFF